MPPAPRRARAEGGGRAGEAKGRLPPVDMIRDARIRELPDLAIADGAVVAAVIYETADGRIIVRGAPATAIKGMLVEALMTFKGTQITFI